MEPFIACARIGEVVAELLVPGYPGCGVALLAEDHENMVEALFCCLVV